IRRCCLFCRLCRHLHLSSFPTRRSSDLGAAECLAVDGDLADADGIGQRLHPLAEGGGKSTRVDAVEDPLERIVARNTLGELEEPDRKSTRLNSSHVKISYAVFCLKKKKL